MFSSDIYDSLQNKCLPKCLFSCKTTKLTWRYKETHKLLSVLLFLYGGKVSLLNKNSEKKQEVKFSENNAKKNLKVNNKVSSLTLPRVWCFRHSLNYKMYQKYCSNTNRVLNKMSFCEGMMTSLTATGFHSTSSER